MSSEGRVCIIGAGNVGQSLFAALKGKAYHAALIGKDLNQQRAEAAQSDLILITTQDDKIQSVCENIAGVLRVDSVVAHCSGALDSTVLAAAEEAGCSTGSAHPLNTFPNTSAAKKLLTTPDHNTACFISGSAPARKALNALFESLNFVVHHLEGDINKEAKIAYHTACVFACNYLTSLAELSLQTAEQAGLDRDVFWQAIQPLMESTLNNISAHGTSAALSGPIARGDLATVSNHLTVLRNAPDLRLRSYKILGQQALRLAQDKGQLKQHDLSELEEKLS